MGILGEIVAKILQVSLFYQLLLLRLLSYSLFFSLVYFFLSYSLLLPDYLFLLYYWVNFNRDCSLDNRYYFHWRRLFDLILIQDIDNFLPDLLFYYLIHNFFYCIDLYITTLFLELSKGISKVL